MKRIKILAVLSAIAVLTALAGDGVRATTFTPTYNVTVPTTAVSANSNITVEFELDSPNARPAAHLSFIPNGFGVSADASVPNGAVVGTLAISTVESMSNGPCSSSALHSYELLDATTNTGNVLADTPRIPSSSWPGFADTNANQLPDAVDKYPNFLNTLYPG
ncbi:MAG: hypothetical protein ACREUU_02540, partial [Gammaproteobacteria bacterium]